MKKNAIYHYCVEGENEERIVNILKSELGCIKSGKVEVFNVVQNKFTVARARLIKENTIMVLIYDTDVTTNLGVLQQNLDFLKKQKRIKDIICIPQVKNLEDELEYACEIKKVEELTKSESRKDYKNDLKKCSNLGAKLRACKFDITKFWGRIPQNEFREFGNDAEKIKGTMF